MNASLPRLAKLAEMHRRTPRRSTSLTAAAVGALLLVGCGTTTIDESVDPTETLTESDLTSDGEAPTTTLAIEGSAADLLAEIGTDMSRLSAEIADAGDEDATIARIEGGWAAIQDEVEATKPELVNGIQATIDMARTAVDSNRPADADKAFSLLTDLVDSYTRDA